MLEPHQNIFEIIMPWVAEKREEEKKLNKANSAAASGKRSATTQKSLSAFFKPKTPAAQQSKAASSVDTPMQEEEEKSGTAAKYDEEETLSILSKVVKSGSVETFDWTYADRKWVNGRQSGQTMTKKVENLQAILINPKWAEHGFDTFASTSQETLDSDENAPANRAGKKAGKKLKQQF